jgi:CrcB protein
MNWNLLAIVMAGGALGAAGRYLLGHYALLHWGDRLPWGTLAANLVGSFAAGFLLVWLEGRGPSALYWRAFLMVGVLGALTTYSALMVECLAYARGGDSTRLFGYLALSLFAGGLLVWSGARLAASLRPL